MNPDTLQSLETLTREFEDLRSKGHTEEAVLVATRRIDACERFAASDAERSQKLADALESRADMLRQLSAHGQARADYERAIALLNEEPAHFIQLGRLHAGLGASCDALDDLTQAAEHWGKSIHYFENNSTPALLDVAAMANNFGFLKKAMGDFDAAETAFLKALEILHIELGEHHEETATVACNLGTLYHDAGHHEPAGKMHRLAVEARVKLYGHEHPETAQSHNYLALVLANSGEHLHARYHFEKALYGFESLGPDYYEDLNEVARHYCDLLRADGEADMAEIVANRVKTITGPRVAA